MIRLLMTLVIAAILFTGAVTAQDVSVRSDHPGEYTVVKGDTLWDISGRFLDKPWQWPAIWHANPQIANPHLIYPGDVISLVYIDGVPQLQLRRGDAVRLSPQMRVIPRDAISPVDFDQIGSFVKDLRILKPEDFEGLPYIVANEENRLNSTLTDVTYARGLNANVGDEFIVARLTNIYDADKKTGEIRRVLPKEHWKQVPNVWDRNQHPYNQTPSWKRRPQNPVGYEMYEVSKVRVTQAGEISVLDIIQDRTEVKPGDFILRTGELGYPETFYPKAMDNVPEGMRVLATTGQRAGVGTYQMVSISGGTKQGVQPGHVFSAFRIGQLVDDRVGYRHGSFSKDSEVRIPETYDGLIMVIRSFDEVSYGMVMTGSRLIAEYDVLKHPDERM